MKLSHRDFDDVRVVSVTENRIDAACAIQFKDEMRHLTDTGPGRVVLDLGSVDFLDSSGLGAVVSALKAVRHGQRLELASLNPSVERVFHLTRMDSIFRIYDTAETAVEGESDAR